MNKTAFKHMSESDIKISNASEGMGMYKLYGSHIAYLINSVYAFLEFVHGKFIHMNKDYRCNKQGIPQSIIDERIITGYDENKWDELLKTNTNK